MRIDIRGLVKELLENKNLIVNYNELNDGGFDLSVRINEEAVNSMSELTPERLACPYCGSNNVQCMYGITALSTNGNINKITRHYLCNDCHKEFDV